MMAKSNIWNVFIPLYWGIQGAMLLFVKSTIVIAIAVIMMTISILKLFIQNRNYGVLFVICCTLYSVSFCFIIFHIFVLFKLSVWIPILTIVNFIMIGCMLRLYGER